MQSILQGTGTRGSPKPWSPGGHSCGAGCCPPPLSPQTRISCKDVPAETLYDVLHDTSYRKKWDSNMIETYDIGRLTVNADVGYYSCEQPRDPQRPPPQAHAPVSVWGPGGWRCNRICPQGSARAP